MDEELKLKAMKIADEANKKRKRVKWIKRLLILSGIGAVGLGIYWGYSRFKIGNLDNLDFTGAIGEYFPNLVENAKMTNLSLANKVSSANNKVIAKVTGANVKIGSKVIRGNTKVVKRATNVKKINPVKIYSMVKKSKKKGWFS